MVLLKSLRKSLRNSHPAQTTHRRPAVAVRRGLRSHGNPHVNIMCGVGWCANKKKDEKKEKGDKEDKKDTKNKNSKNSKKNKRWCANKNKKKKKKKKNKHNNNKHKMSWRARKKDAKKRRRWRPHRVGLAGGQKGFDPLQVAATSVISPEVMRASMSEGQSMVDAWRASPHLVHGGPVHI